MVAQLISASVAGFLAPSALMRTAPASLARAAVPLVHTAAARAPSPALLVADDPVAAASCVPSPHPTEASDCAHPRADAGALSAASALK